MKKNIDKSERRFIPSPMHYHLAFKGKANEIGKHLNRVFTMGDLVGLVGKIPTKDLIDYLN